VKLATHEYVLAACCALLILMGLSGCGMLGSTPEGESRGAVMTLPDGTEVVLTPPAGSTEPADYELPDGSVVTVAPQQPTTPGGMVGKTLGGVLATLLGLPPALGMLAAGAVSSGLGALGAKTGALVV